MSTTEPRRRGPIKIIALIIGIFIIIFGVLGVIGGEALGGVVIMVIGLLPAIYGLKRSGGASAGKSLNADQLHYQNLAHDVSGDDHDVGDVDFDFD